MARGGSGLRTFAANSCGAGRTAPWRGFAGRLCAYDVLRVALGLLLLFAGALKAHQLATEPLLGGSLVESRWFLVALVEFEILFGLWLLAGLLPGATWALAVACFVCFAAVSALKGMGGHASCGCFGRVQVNPWLTAGLDGAVVMALLRWRPRALGWRIVFGLPTERKRLGAVCAVWLALGVPAALAMSNPDLAQLSEAGLVSAQGRVVLLEPEKWIGKRFPLLSYIDTPEPLDAGRWLVLLYHHNCPACWKAIAGGEGFGGSLLSGADDRRTALVELPPFGRLPEDLDLRARNVRWGRLDRGRDVFVRTPLALELENGVVRRNVYPSAALNK